MKAINIDEYLENQGLEFELHGKKFTVTDLNDKVREMLEAEQPNEREIVKELLGCTDEDLKGYGLVAFAAIIREVTENLLRPPSLPDQLKD
ncbi:MAG: hypothetical protein DRJ47_11475 [Thermoprotei archaeon]|mgnify:CR=1 FL=1|nr:MAG: hypothetical protein DRJ47_11475 [Thermoprotei archaeon]